MCGIAGFKQTNHHSSQRLMKAMLQTIEHRGPDDEGIWVNQDAMLTLGQRRLSIIDLSAQGHQPMHSSSSRNTITYNGEIYNYKELRKELESHGYSFQSNTDTEVILAGYELWNYELVDKLVGMFAFCIWDDQKQEMFLARDRAGEKPLYYSQAGGSFAFASEIAALQELPWISDELDYEAIALYLVHQSIPAPHSIYKDIKKLEPASVMVVSNHGVRKWRYWDPLSFVAQDPLDLSEEDATEQLESLLQEAIKGQMVADVPLGAFLSGGIDSSLVVALMAEQSSQTTKTFTIGFEDPQYNEANHAAEVAAHLGTDHTTEYLTELDCLRLVEKIPDIYGEPFADPSALPTYMVSSVAKSQVTVSLSGDGGDEAFGGYARYAGIEKFEKYKFEKLGLLKPLMERMPNKLSRFAKFAGLSAKDINLEVFQQFSHESAKRLIGVSAEHATYNRAWEHTKNRPYRRRATVADMMTYMPETILAKVDRAAMAVSLETRAPLLDHRILEFSLRLPDQLLKEKILLRNILYKRVPKRILERPKKGFGVPVGKWFRYDLKDSLQEGLSSSRLTDLGIVDRAYVNTLLSEHLSGQQDHKYALWTLYSLSTWFESQNKSVAAKAA